MHSVQIWILFSIRTTILLQSLRTGIFLSRNGIISMRGMSPWLCEKLNYECRSVPFMSSRSVMNIRCVREYFKSLSGFSSVDGKSCYECLPGLISSEKGSVCLPCPSGWVSDATRTLCALTNKIDLCQHSALIDSCTGVNRAL